MKASDSGVVTALLLALPPTLTSLAAMALVELGTHAHVLFASLTVSAFLVYRDTGHAMNKTWTMVGAHLIALLCGIAAALSLHGGYLAATSAMLATIVLLVVARAVHPPAIATSVGFAFAPPQPSAVPAFLAALAITAVFYMAQHGVVRYLARTGRLKSP